MKSHSKRSVFAMATALVLALSACGGGTEEGDGSAEAGDDTPNGELTFMVAEYSPATQPFWAAQIDSFETEYPDVSVNLEVVGWQRCMTPRPNGSPPTTSPTW